MDKDFVAVEYSKKNAQINGIENVEILLSNGFDQIGERKFDLIVSNLPAKTGKELYYLYFYDALLRMNPGGRLYVVTITGLRKFIQKFAEVASYFNEIGGQSELEIFTALSLSGKNWKTLSRLVILKTLCNWGFIALMATLPLCF